MKTKIQNQNSNSFSKVKAVAKRIVLLVIMILFSIGNANAAFTTIGHLDNYICVTGTTYSLSYSVIGYNGSATYTITATNGGTLGTLITAGLQAGHFSMTWNSTSVSNGSVITVQETLGGTVTTHTVSILACCTDGTNTFWGTSTTNPSGDQADANYMSSSSFGAGVPITVSNKSFSINGDFAVNADIEFDNCEIKLGQNATITLNSGTTLTLDGSRLSSCGVGLWTSIIANGSNRSVIITNSVLEDAIKAVDVSNGASFSITGSVFNKNTVGLYVHNYSSMPGTAVLTSSIYTSRNFSSVYGGTPSGYAGTIIAAAPAFTGYASDYTLAGRLGFKGIETNSVVPTGSGSPLVIGTPGYDADYNLFDNMDHGVYASASSHVQVANNQFQNIVLETSNNTGAANSAIYATSSVATNIVTITENTFTICQYAVYSLKNNLDIENNSLDQMELAGIFLSNNGSSSALDIKINSNTIKNVANGSWGNAIACSYVTKDGLTITGNVISEITGRGISIGESDGSTDNIISISDNTITYSAYDSHNLGIYLANAALNGTATASSADVIRNTIIGATAGIYANNKRYINIGTSDLANMNLIRLNMSAYTSGRNYYGIRVTGSSGVKIESNEVENTDAAGTTPYSTTSGNASHVKGISLEDSNGGQVLNNFVKYTGYNVYVSGTNTSSSLLCNNLTYSPYGIYFLSGTSISDMEATGKSTGTWFAVNGVKDIAGGVSAAAKWYYTSGTTAPTSSATNITIAVATDATSACGDYGRSADFPAVQRENDLGKIVRNEFVYDDLSRELKLRDSIFAYNYLKADTTWLTLGADDDSIYQQFYASCRLSNIDKFYRVNMLLNATNDSAGAYSLNQSITTDCTPDANRKTVNEIYLSHLGDVHDSDFVYQPSNIYTSDELATLEGIAYQTAEAGGSAVYSARAILGLMITDDETVNNRSMTSVTNKQVMPADYNLYPNPNNGSMYLNYTLGENDKGYITIYNMLGTEISTYQLIKGNKQMVLNQKQLESGIYFYTITVNDYRIKSDKIIINK